MITMFRIFCAIGMMYLGLCLTIAAHQSNYIGMVAIVLIGSTTHTLFDYFKPVKDTQSK